MDSNAQVRGKTLKLFILAICNKQVDRLCQFADAKLT